MPSLFVVSFEVTWANDAWQSSACNIHEKFDDARVGSPNECTDEICISILLALPGLKSDKCMESDHYLACVSTRQKSLLSPGSSK